MLGSIPCELPQSRDHRPKGVTRGADKPSAPFASAVPLSDLDNDSDTTDNFFVGTGTFSGSECWPSAPFAAGRDGGAFGRQGDLHTFSFGSDAGSEKTLEVDAWNGCEPSPAASFAAAETFGEDDELPVKELEALRRLLSTEAARTQKARKRVRLSRRDSDYGGRRSESDVLAAADHAELCAPVPKRAKGRLPNIFDEPLHLAFAMFDTPNSLSIGQELLPMRF